MHELELQKQDTIEERLDSLTEDYPVQGHTRSGKPVKAHTRGEGKTAQQKGWETAKEKYPNEDVHVTKSGRIYIAVAEGGGRWSPINRTTQKAIKVSGYGWVPKKASFTKGNDPRYEKVYIASWFYDKNPNIEKKLSNEKLYRLEKQIKEYEESIRDLPNQAHLSEKDIKNATTYFKKEIQRTEKEIEEEKELLKEEEIGDVSFKEAQRKIKALGLKPRTKPVYTEKEIKKLENFRSKKTSMSARRKEYLVKGSKYL